MKNNISDRLSIYTMDNNSIFGSSFAVVYHASQLEIKDNGLTSGDITLYFKTLNDVNNFQSIEDIRSNKVFCDRDIIALRVASECQFGLFGDSHCDCESQRQAALKYIAKHQGIYVHLPQEAQGRGLYYKAQELQLQVNGIDPCGKFIGKKDLSQAARILLNTDDVDKRRLTVLKKIFRYLNLLRYSYILISSSPKKSIELSNEVGITIDKSRDVSRVISIDNIGEYLSKLYTKDFKLDHEDLRKIYQTILSSDYIPERASTVLLHIEDALNSGKKYCDDDLILLRMIKAAKAKDNLNRLGLFENINNSRNEYQTEIVIKNSQLKALFNCGVLDGVSGLAFEQNFFYTLGYLNGVRSQDLKIRRRSKINPRSTDRIIDNTIVYKIRMDDGTFLIRDMIVKDLDLANLMIFAFKAYEVNYVPVFTHTCELSRECADLSKNRVLVLLKRYSCNLRTLSLMGDKEHVLNIVEKIKHEICPVIEIPDPTNHTTVNKDLILDFEYDRLASEELKIFKKYYIG